MKDIISSSDLLKPFPVELIHNGVDTEIFRRVNSDRSLLSDFLSLLEKDTKVFLFSSYNICDKRKGLDRLFSALEMLKNIKRCNVALIVIGNIDKEIKKDISFPIYYTGLVKSQAELAKIYSSVDYFVNASYEEGFAQTPLEAMACGTPVITTPCSGASDLIKPFNGIICNGCCADNLVEGIIRALKIEYDVEAIRQHIIDRYDYSKIAKKYIKLYKNI
jgi:glycosyltransferase involved in cell wall biosynthesis